LQVFISVFPLVDLHGLRGKLKIAGTSMRQRLYTGITASGQGLCSDSWRTGL